MKISSDHLRHLDGLRGIAILGVLLFHFEIPYFSGGYAGVDMFLTLSGFLITRNILVQQKEKVFSLKQFYIRRFYRLYPASSIVTGITVFAAALMFPSDLAHETASSGAASLMFFSNTFFHMKSSYFDVSSKFKPLLHTWSLSLEEQYYFLWPIFLVFIGNKTRRIQVLTISILFLSSLSLSVLLSQSHASFVFFELPCRIFQFITGASIAYGESRGIIKINQLENKKLKLNFVIIRQLSAGFSLLFLLFSFHSLPPQAPSIRMLPVNISTLLLIILSETVIGKKLLCLSFLRILGKLAYSIYLVHWPLYVFSKYVSSSAFDIHQIPLANFIITVLFGKLLYDFVENPVRKGLGNTRRNFFVALTVSITIIVHGLYSKGFAYRKQIAQSSSALHFVPNSFSIDPADIRKRCPLSHRATKNFKTEDFTVHCVGDLKGERSNFTFYGDSFTSHLEGALHTVGVKRKAWFEINYQTGCRLLPQRYRDRAKQNCLKAHDSMWQKIDQLPQGTTVIFSNSFWWNDEDEMNSTMQQFKLDLDELKLGFGIATEPAGVSELHENFLHCQMILQLPFGIILQNIGKIMGYHVFKACGHPEHGLPPFKDRYWQSNAYDSIFSTYLENSTLINYIRPACNLGMNNNSYLNSETVCHFPAIIPEYVDEKPVVLEDTGYNIDLRHLSLQGSIYLANITEQALFR